MKSLKVKILFFLLIGNVLCKALNKSLLINEYSFGTDSVVIDLSVESIDSIHLNTFNEYAKLEELYLEDNKLTRLEAGLFSNLVNLRELWLESNQLVSIDKNIFNGLINLELVCLSNNPISILFTDLTSLCGSTNSKCKIKTKDRCQRKVTTRTTTLATITSTSTTLLTTNSRQSYSLSHDISINKMKSQGYQVVYDFPYSHFTTFSEMNSIKSQCSSETILCAGGVASNNKDNLLLVSCGNCHSVLTQTPQNQPVLTNGAYWYMTDTFSFGFSPSNTIVQSNCDYYDYTDNKRLCWHLQGYSGGWRLGKLVSIYTSDYHKIILLS